MLHRNTIALIIIFSILLTYCSKDPEQSPNEPPQVDPGPRDTLAVFSIPSNNGPCNKAYVAGTYRQQTALNTSNIVSIPVMVTQTGAWTFSTDTVNGMRFSGSGRFTRIGSQLMILNGSGTPVNAGSFSIPITAGGVSCDFPVTVANNWIVSVRGIFSMGFSFDENMKPYGFSSTDNINSFSCLSLVRATAQSDTVVARLVNARKGIVEPWDNYYNSVLIVSFSNINAYDSATNLNAVDTAGKVQIWIYRKDGKDLVPASGNKPAIRMVIQVPGTFEWSHYSFSGTLGMPYPYLNPWYNVNAAFMENMFASTDWKLQYLIRRD